MAANQLFTDAIAEGKTFKFVELEQPHTLYVGPGQLTLNIDQLLPSPHGIHEEMRAQGG